MTSTWTLPGLQLSDLTLPVPLDHADPTGTQIEVFARVVTADGGEDRPYLVFLQGGPGSEAPRPLEASSPGWLARALREHRVVMLDQRGTGRSTPVGPDTTLPEGAIPGAETLRAATASQQAQYLTHFRADAIVHDAELLREHLEVETWSLLGQSFGGFTALRYLSAAATSVDKALFTGGLPTVGPGMDEVYATTWQGMIGRSERYWARFPGDRDRFRRLADAADAGRLRLPDGQRVGVERLRRLGHLLGASQGAERLHYLLDLDPAAPALAHDLAAALPFGGRNPLYAVIHESCWADGVATRWAGDRAQPDAVKEDPTL
ncbi:MAG: alpha/beta hydrolase, partial [Brachybacterium sp.]|nr:alpha/beta hydrolase [Brachybacterium sp.]